VVHLTKGGQEFPKKGTLKGKKNAFAAHIVLKKRSRTEQTTNPKRRKKFYIEEVCWERGSEKTREEDIRISDPKRFQGGGKGHLRKVRHPQADKEILLESGTSKELRQRRWGEESEGRGAKKRHLSPNFVLARVKRGTARESGSSPK